MKNSFFIVLLLLSTAVFAQQEFYYPMMNYGGNVSEWKTLEMIYIDSPHLQVAKVVTYVETPAKGKHAAKKVRKEEIAFNENNQQVFQQCYARSGKPTESIKITYQNKDISQERYSAAGNLEYTTNYKFDNDSNLICYEVLKGPEKKVQKQLLTTYNANKQMLDRQLFKSGGKLSTHWTYEYNGKQLWRTTAYNGKGKMLHVWNHDCLPEGTEAGKTSKDTTLVCKKFTTDSAGNLIYIVRTVDENGDYLMSRSVYYSDTLLKAYYKYDLKNRIVASYIAHNKHNFYSESYNYFKGKERYHSYNEYQEGRCVRIINTLQKKPMNTNKLFYDQNGYLVKIEVWDDQQKALEQTKYFEITPTL